MKMNELILKVEDWGGKNGLKATNRLSQVQKILEEFAETVKAFNKNDTPEIKDGVGDTLVTIILSMWQHDDRLVIEPPHHEATFASALHSLSTMATMVEDGVYHSKTYKYHANVVIKFLGSYAKQYGWNLDECLETAYNVIKDRVGVTTEDGFFKDNDLK